MKLVAGNLDIPCLGGFEDHLYEQDQSRPALRLRFQRLLTSEEYAAIDGQELLLIDNTGTQIGTFIGYNLVHEVTMTIFKATDAELAEHTTASNS
jgi:hypothetical protein